jgi:hypothetical protein
MSIASPSTSRMFDTTLPASEPRTTLGQAVSDCEESDDQLGRVAKLAFRNPPDARSPNARSVLGRFADEPRERYQSAAARTNRTVSPAWKAYARRR